MRTSESVIVPAPAARVFPLVADLATYPSWLGMVHDVVPESTDVADRPAWSVELRARVGPFARSKQLRMVRTALDVDRFVMFERDERDGRRHAAWTLRAELADVDGGTLVTMHLAYDGTLWTGGLLERVLDEEIRRGRTGLVRAVAGSDAGHDPDDGAG